MDGRVGGEDGGRRDSVRSDGVLWAVLYDMYGDDSGVDGYVLLCEEERFVVKGKERRN